MKLIIWILLIKINIKFDIRLEFFLYYSILIY